MRNQMGLMIKALGAAALLLAAGCESAPEEIPGKTPQFVTNDCALLSAIGRQNYKLSPQAPRMSVRLVGEDAPWTPGCDWQGLNLVQVSGPEGEAATATLDKVTFTRPRYDAEGAMVRTSITRGTETTNALCRLVRAKDDWTVQSCGPDPRLTQPRAAAPSIADQTPQSKIPNLPVDRQVSPRDLVIPQADPGSSPSSRPN